MDKSSILLRFREALKSEKLTYDEEDLVENIAEFLANEDFEICEFIEYLIELKERMRQL